MRTASFCGFAMLATTPGVAQVLGSFEQLPLRVNLGDRVRIEDQSGARTTGRVTRLTRTEIALQTDGGERRFAADSVREAAVTSHSLRRSALIGAGALAVVSAVTACTREDRDNCALVGLGAAPLGAGLGLMVGGLVPLMKTVYRAPQHGAPEAMPPASTAGAASLLEELGLRVNLDDEVEVRPQSGTKVVGRLLVTGGLGAGIGLGVGALMPRASVVFPAEGTSRTSVMPVLTRDAVAVRVIRQW